MNRRSRLRHIAPTGLAALFIGSGTLHLVRPEFFAAAVPGVLPEPGAIIFTSGIAELVCAAGLLSGARWAGPISAILLVAVFPGNVWMAVTTSADPNASTLARLAVWARLPLQIPLIWAALQSRTPARAPRA